MGTHDGAHRVDRVIRLESETPVALESDVLL